MRSSGKTLATKDAYHSYSKICDVGKFLFAETISRLLRSSWRRLFKFDFSRGFFEIEVFAGAQRFCIADRSFCSKSKLFQLNPINCSHDSLRFRSSKSLSPLSLHSSDWPIVFLRAHGSRDFPVWRIISNFSFP